MQKKEERFNDVRRDVGIMHGNITEIQGILTLLQNNKKNLQTVRHQSASAIATASARKCRKPQVPAVQRCRSEIIKIKRNMNAAA